jgi:hypothetical protein
VNAYIKQILEVLSVELHLSLILAIMNQPRVCIVIPALNKETTIGQDIDEIPKQAQKQDGYLVNIPLVNNHSAD